jgi:hypothetical protein
MATPFNVALAMREPPAEAEARAAGALADPARAVGLRLTKRAANELRYGPRVQFPFLVMLWHNLNGELMTVTFALSEDGGTRVTIAGAVARRHQPFAADPDHWSEALGALPAA